MEQDNLHSRQVDKNNKHQYAVFLPALSSFYAFYIGLQRHENYVDASRLPASFNNGVEGLNFLNKTQSYFYYPQCLYSAGHAYLDTKFVPKEDMTRNRDPNSFVLGDSGGFQIGKGVWEGDWRDPNCPKAHAKRDGVLKWMDAFMDYGMVLDIPAWVARSPRGVAATGISSYQEAVDGTKINNNYWMKNRTGRCKFLNVLQGENHTEAEDWYQQMKNFCDPKIYPSTHFNGWAMGGQNMCDIHLVLYRIVMMIRDGLLEKGQHDWMHFLGTSKLEWACLLTDIQRAVRKYHNENFTISFDCASPFLANAKGLVYDQLRIANGSKWTYSMSAGIDDKKYATDTRPYGDVARNDNVIPNFMDSHITKNLKVNDVCYYKPGDLNKIGKEGKTSWDSFSYALQMAHNTWMHINAVLTANEQYDNNCVPGMLRKSSPTGFIYFRQIVDDIIANAANQRSLDLINDYNKFWIDIIGQRGYVGKKTINSSTFFNAHFEIEEDDNVADIIEDTLSKDLKKSKKSEIKQTQFSTLFE